jgi:hypothetical protein
MFAKKIDSWIVFFSKISMTFIKCHTRLWNHKHVKPYKSVESVIFLDIFFLFTLIINLIKEVEIYDANYSDYEEIQRCTNKCVDMLIYFQISDRANYLQKGKN